MLQRRAKMDGFEEENSAKTSSENIYSDIEEDEYIPMSGSLHDDKDYLDIDIAQNVAYAALKNLAFAAEQDEPTHAKYGSEPASPTTTVSAPCNPESSVKSKAPVRIKSGKISNAGIHLYTEASPTKDKVPISTPQGKDQDIYSYAAPVYGDQFRKAATLNLPPSGKKAISSKSNTILPRQKREDFERELDGLFALGLPESKILSKRMSDVSGPAEEKGLALELYDIIDGERIYENGDNCTDYMDPFDKLEGSFGRGSNMSSSSSSQGDLLGSPIDSPISLNGTSNKNRNMSYELKEMENGEPSQKDDFIRGIVNQNRRWRFLVLLAIFILVASSTIVAVQLSGIINGPSFEKSSSKRDSLQTLTQKVKHMQDKMNLRTHEMNILRRKTEYQEALIQSLQNVLKIHNMTNNLTTMDTKARMRRSSLKTSNVGKIQMKPGPKGQRGQPGFYSFTKCRRLVQMNSQYADVGELDIHSVHVTIVVDERKEKVMAAACSSHEATVQNYQRLKFKERTYMHQCACLKPSQSGNVRCEITAYICPVVE